MTYPIPVFTKPSPECTAVAELMKSKVLWTGPEIAKIIGCTVKAAGKRLFKLAEAGVIKRLGTSGPAVRWCRVEFEDVGRVEVSEIAAQVKKDRYRRHSVWRSEKRAEMRAAKEANKPPPKRVIQPQAFTIPPRGVPCSVWQLAAAHIGGA
jgi:hypothetical protein